MPAGRSPARKEKKKPKKSAAAKSLRSLTTGEPMPTVEVIPKRRKPREEEED